MQQDHLQQHLVHPHSILTCRQLIRARSRAILVLASSSVGPTPCHAEGNPRTLLYRIQRAVAARARQQCCLNEAFCCVCWLACNCPGWCCYCCWVGGVVVAWCRHCCCVTWYAVMKQRHSSHTCQLLAAECWQLSELAPIGLLANKTLSMPAHILSTSS